MTSARRSRLRSWLAPLVLALACLLVYNANLRQIGAGDSMAARYLPLLLWHHGTLEMNTQAALVARGHPFAPAQRRPANDDAKAAYFEPHAYWLVRTRAHELASFYPVVTPLLVMPLYVPALLWLDEQGWEPRKVDWVAQWMEKLAASILAALASVLMFLVLRREGHRWALPLALAFAFGTNTWMISSQALWQHGTGEVLIALALLLVIGPATALRLSLLGVVCVLMAANRPPDALIAAALGGWVVLRQRRDARWLIGGAALPLAALLYYNLGFMGDLAGGYGLVKPPRDFFQNGGAGLAGLLVSPTRGLLVFTPFLIFVPLGLWQRLRAPASRGLAVALALAVLIQLVVYAHGDWRAGASWGPRWLTDLLPILIWMLAPAPHVLRAPGRTVLVATIVAAIGVQTIGAFWYTKISDERLYADGAESMRGAWDFGNVPFLTELRHPPAHGDLLCDAAGSIDRIGETPNPPPDGSAPALKPGASLEGWALACDRSPAQVGLLIDGHVVGTGTDFAARPDVTAATGIAAPSGWQVAANLWGIAPGERVLQLAVRPDPRGEFRIVREQRVVVVTEHIVLPADPRPPPSTSDLDAMAAHVSALLKEHQTAYGAWLTAHTASAAYTTPQPEMNTFLTSLLVDLLSPVARRQDLDAALQRARAHLAAQIESNGLVRYHGLPDGPTIGTLGCAITPDPDDTALVWRLTGNPNDPRREPMLETLSRYRDARGLYRSWLAARKNYQCLDPGRDPNPTDMTIQMHVYLMLRQFDPAAAQTLCGAMLRAFRDEDVWVYYSQSALLPYLRAAELRQLGCPLPLPAERLALAVKGQDVWSDLARRLVDASASPDNTDGGATTRQLLGRLAADDFAEVRRAPPLLYHNDVSATVRRFYWSEDVGYALWLRLYETIEARDPSPVPASP